MKKVLPRFVILTAAFLLFTGQSGCVSAKPPAAIDGGVYKSIDSGATWLQKAAVPETGGRVVGFPDVDITGLTFDPQDHNFIYINSPTEGLFTTADGGERWNQIKEVGYVVKDVAVDYSNKCRYLTLTPGKLIRTANCGRDFKDVLTETRPDYQLRFVLTDHFNNNVVYVANTREMMRSNDFGDTWTTIARFTDNISDILMDRKDSRILLVGFEGSGIQRTLDGGKSWIDEREGLAKLDGGSNVISLRQHPTKDGNYFAATNYGIIKTADYAATWTGIPLLTPPNSIKITAFAVDPANGDILYYTTATTFYKTVDGGKTWLTLKLPTVRIPTYIEIDPKDAKVMYMGTKQIPKQ